jgi:hypothetical protein
MMYPVIPVLYFFPRYSTVPRIPVPRPRPNNAMAETNCCQCCFCCLNDDQKISKVLARFPPVLCSAAKADGSVQKLIGRVVLAPTGQSLVSPISGRACAFYDVVVQQRKKRDDKYVWVQICQERRSVDFFLQDDNGGSVFIAGGAVKAYTVDDARGGSSGGFLGIGGQSASPGLKALLERNGISATGFFGGSKNIRASEGVFEQGEALAALGTVNPGVGGPTMQLGQLQEASVTEAYMDANGWGDWDKQAWSSLTKSFACVLISDHASLVGGMIQSQKGAPVPQQQMMVRQAQPQPIMVPAQQQPTTTAVMVVPVQQPTLMTITCPPGVAPGTLVQLQTADGRTVQVAIPQGVAPGMTFQVQV